MKKWKIITLLSGLLIAVTASTIHLTASANTIPLDAQVKLEAGLPADADIPPYKLQTLLKEHQLREKAKSQPLAFKPSFEPPQSIGPVEKGPRGILSGDDLGTPPVRSSQFKATNEWVGDINGKLTALFAGAETQNAKQGVIVFQQPGDDLAPDFYRTSGLDGALTIISVNGSVLTLKAKDGATYTFDIATRSLTRQ